MFSGIGLRTAIYISFLIATILYINWYVKRLKKSNKGSILGDNWFPSNALSSEKETEKTEVPWTIRHKLILLVSALSLIAFLIGAFRLHWTDAEMTATFIFIAITAGIIGGMKANDIASTFLSGCQNLIYGALIVGMARCISVILEQGKLLDTIVNQLAQSLEGHSPVFGVIGMYVSSAALHFRITFPHFIRNRRICYFHSDIGSISRFHAHYTPSYSTGCYAWRRCSELPQSNFRCFNGRSRSERHFLQKMDSIYGSTCIHLVYHWTYFSYCWCEY